MWQRPNLGPTRIPMQKQLGGSNRRVSGSRGKASKHEIYLQGHRIVHVTSVRSLVYLSIYYIYYLSCYLFAVRINVMSAPMVASASVECRPVLHPAPLIINTHHLVRAINLVSSSHDHMVPHLNGTGISELYHTVNRLRSFLSSGHLGHLGHSGYSGHLQFAIWVIRVIQVIRVILVILSFYL